MEAFSLIIIGLLGLLAGGGLGFFITRRMAPTGNPEAERNLAVAEERVRGLQAQIQTLQEAITKKETELNEVRLKQNETDQLLATERSRRQAESQAAEEKLQELRDLKKQVESSFKVLSSEALKHNNQSFLDLAKQALARAQDNAKGDLDKRQTAINELVKPIRESLNKVENRIGEIEKDRAKSFGELGRQLQILSEGNRTLQQETATLVNALRKPSVRGSWGELQLRRAVEFAGMQDRCDFHEQTSRDTEEGGRIRPDMIVNLPNDRQIIVDAKAPMEAYLQAIEATDEEARARLMKAHARQLHDKLKDLATKRYWQQFSPSPEFVVLFLPNEALFSAALEADHTLIDFGAQNRVIPATPTTLIALLFAVAYGWQQEAVAEHAQKVNDLGRELYDRICTLGGHFGKLGRELDKAVDSYNKTARSLDTRVLVSARKFQELSAGGKKEIEEPKLLDQRSQPPQSDELQE